MKTRFWLSSFLLAMLVSVRAYGHGLTITNVRTGEYDYVSGHVEVIFDISWNKSWRLDSGTPPGNWDAAWVFVKFRVNGGAWGHAKLNGEGSHFVPSGGVLKVGLADTGAAFDAATNPGVGVFLYRSGVGSGTFSLSGVKLSWRYAGNGVVPGDVVDVKVFGVEMVYVPEGAFYAGDGDSGGVGSTAAFRQGSTDNDPWYISSEGALSVTNSAGNGTGSGGTAGVYYYVSNGNGGEDATGSVFTVPAGYPKGYGGFYVMKGEISQKQWVKFFNTLTATQQATRDITDGSGKNSDLLVYRNSVSWPGSGLATLPDQGGGATYAWAGCNYLSWGDVVACLDWSGLRPLSELEYEKAGRGPVVPVMYEYAWGSTSITRATSLTSIGLIGERGQAGSNIAYNFAAGVQGPVRVGSFGKGVVTRAGSGAGYYGAMDLSGNLWERTVTLGNVTGRGFSGRYHGDGVLTSSGDSNVTGWPSQAAVSAGFRGGSWFLGATNPRLSDRIYAALVLSDRGSDLGGRGARVAP